MQFPCLLLSATTTVSEDTTNSIQAVADTVQDEVEQTTSILHQIFTPMLEKIPSLIFALLAAFVGHLIIKSALKVMVKLTKKSNMDSIMASFVHSVVKIVLYVFLVVIVLSMLGVPMDSIVAVIASAGVAVALALKDSLSNLAGGFIILLSKPLKQGDLVEVNGTMGKVESISILYTRMVTVDNTTVFIPNGVVAANKIINYTDNDTRRVDVYYGISYEDDIDQARKVLLDMAKAIPEVLDEPATQVHVTAHEDSSVTLKLEAWTKSENYWNVYYQVMENGKKSFDKNGISIPFPQMDVHMKS